MVLRVSREDEKRGLDVAEHGVVLASAAEAERLRKRGFARRLVGKVAARIRRGGRRRRAGDGRSPSPHHSGHVSIEFVEDVGHAANVSATVRTFATTLRQRALAKRSSAEAVEVEVLEEQPEEVAGSGAAGAAFVAAGSA